MSDLKARKLGDMPSMTRVMLETLQLLADAQRKDVPFLGLEGAHGRTIRALVKRDWIFASPGVDGRTLYKMTGRGERALKVYSSPLRRRRDGLCPDCGLRPKVRSRTGKARGYCAECERKNGRAKYRLGIGHNKSGTLCPMCKKRPRHVRASGYVDSYCLDCKRLRAKDEKQRLRARLLARIAAGEHVPCIKKGCDQPRYVMGTTVADWCYEHYREYRNARYRRMSAEAAERYYKANKGMVSP